MKVFFRVLNDSSSQAFQQLKANRLRTLLSLLGVTIGIFCIISVFSAVDSLERDIRKSFQKLGDDVLYISKMPWTEDPNRNYWKYMRRPNPNYNDYKALTRRVSTADKISYSVFVGARTIKFKSSAVNGAIVIAVTKDYADMFSIEFEDGRFFSDFEFESGSDKVVLGYKIAENLFGKINPIGRTVKLMGRQVQVVGVIEKSGEDMFNPIRFDWCVIVAYPMGKKLANLSSDRLFGTSLNVKAKSGENLDRVRDEVVVALRANRRLRPIEEDNFSINELSLLSGILDQFFGVLNTIGFVIGGFALLVGAFSVANIMFVSVKERTNQIGIKKALGAKPNIILLEFLIESIILCIIGGAIGIAIVFGLMELLSARTDNFTFVLSVENVLYGILISSVIGVISGIVPAYFAARLDPVIAIRK